MSTKLEVAKFLLGAAGQSSPGKRAGTLAGGGNTTVRYGTVKTVDGTSVTILMEDTGETLYTMTTTPVAVGDRVAIIKNGQSVIVYATDQIVEMINKTVVDGDAEYAVGDDANTAPENGWSTTMPSVEQGKYLWMRYTTTLKDGTVKTSTPVCLTTAGVRIDRARDMYYLSTSETQVTGGTWVYDECPEWQEGHYIWTRMEITYDDGSVLLTDPVLMSALNQANENAAKVTWYVSSDDDGLHISSVKNNPNGGFNVLLTGTSTLFRDGTNVVGEYTGSSISFLGSELYSTNVFRIKRDINGITYFGGDDIVMCFGDIEGETASQRRLSIQDIIMRTKYANAQITLACSSSKTLTSSDSPLDIGTTIGAYYGPVLFSTGEQYIRVRNPFYSNGGRIVVEVSASATAGQMSSGKNLALSIRQGTSESFSAAESVATAITSSANIMTTVAITPVTIEVTTSYAYFFLAARSTGGGGVLDSYFTQPSYCPKLTVRIVDVTYE